MKLRFDRHRCDNWTYQFDRDPTLTRRVFYEVKAHDVRVDPAATMILTAVAALAAWLPSRRAARMDPMVPLRHE